MNATACGPSLLKAIPWRYRMDGPLSGEENMRIDLESLEAQKDPAALPLLRFFQWDRPTPSYGRLQREEEVSRFFPGQPMVRRPTGGGMVRHDKDLSLSLTWRRDHPGFPRCLSEIYRAIHETVRTAMQETGYGTTLYTPVSRRNRAMGFCFAEPVKDDLIWKERKILGGALRVTSWGRLYQGNLLVDVFGLNAGSFRVRLAESFAKRFFLCPPVNGFSAVSEAPSVAATPLSGS